MTKNLLIAALAAFALVACGKKEEPKTTTTTTTTTAPAAPAPAGTRVLASDPLTGHRGSGSGWSCAFTRVC